MFPATFRDANGQLAVYLVRLLRKVSKEQGTAILVVTHDTRMVSEVDGIIRLMDGRMVQDSDSKRQLQSQDKGRKE